MHGNSKQEKIQAWIKRMAGEAIDQQIATRLRWDLKIGLTADVAALVRLRDEVAGAISYHATEDYTGGLSTEEYVRKNSRRQGCRIVNTKRVRLNSRCPRGLLVVGRIPG